ncbi:MAG: prepilin-type N-terminal cleavage/methylation domain-containing protein [Oscillospiraceae bacterium]|nr:prepilin-type N-terminal cleavage/methylation domain-containing protein [Oscillospiraceae bacterium]
MKNNRKGFTITELVIVIAVIAILAAVLIPTFSNLIEKANNSADLQEARNAYSEYLAVVNAQPASKVYVQGGDQYFEVTGGKISETPEAATPATGVLVSLNGDNVVIDCLTDAASHTDCTTCNGQNNA